MSKRDTANPRSLISRHALKGISTFQGVRLLATLAKSSKARLLILGSGWAAASLAKHAKPERYALTVVSRINHLVFTPMLPSAAVGTVDERSTAISIFGIQPELKRLPNQFLTGEAVAVDPYARKVTCKDALGGVYDLEYDRLVIATGSQGSTFGTPGVEEHAVFLRSVSNAASIRNALVRNWQLSRSPGQSENEKKRLLQTLIVGGGPTGVEFAGELSDLISSDLRDIDGYRASQAKIVIVEAQELLGNFDATLRDYAASKLRKQGIEVIEKGVVKEVRATEAVLNNGQSIPFGLCVWSTGVGPTDFTTSLPFAKTAKGRIAVDECLRVLKRADAPDDPQRVEEVDAQKDEHHANQQQQSEGLQPFGDIYALGDCCANIGTPLPSLAQVAEQQGKYLAKELNRGSKGSQPFIYKPIGSMATLGDRSAIIELGRSGGHHVTWKGFSSYVAWKSAYLTKLYTFRSRFQILSNWLATAIFGRDVSRW